MMERLGMRRKCRNCGNTAGGRDCRSNICNYIPRHSNSTKKADVSTTFGWKTIGGRQVFVKEDSINSDKSDKK